MQRYCGEGYILKLQINTWQKKQCNSLYYYYYYHHYYICNLFFKWSSTGNTSEHPRHPSLGTQQLCHHSSCVQGCPKSRQQKRAAQVLFMANMEWKCPQDWSMRENGIYYLHFLVSSDISGASHRKLSTHQKKCLYTSGLVLEFRESVQFSIAFSFGYSISCNIFWSDGA